MFVGSLFVRAWGRESSPSVVVLDSMLPDPESVAKLGELLSDRFRVLAIDRPGFGKSPALVPFTWKRIRDHVDATFEELGIEETVVIGHSMTTYEALDLALHGRTHIRALYLMGVIAGLDAPTRAAYVALARQFRTNRMAVRKAYLEQAFEPSFVARHPEILARLARNIDAVDQESVVAQLQAMGDLPDLRPELHRIAVPILIRTGMGDTVTPIDLSREVANGIPGSMLEEVPERRHFLLMDDEPATQASIVRFVERHRLARGP